MTQYQRSGVLGRLDWKGCEGCAENWKWAHKAVGVRGPGCPDIQTDVDVDWPSGEVRCRAYHPKGGGSSSVESVQSVEGGLT